MGWWRNPESNWGHKDFQSSALPTELFRRTHGKTKYEFKSKVCLWVNRERMEQLIFHSFILGSRCNPLDDRLVEEVICLVIFVESIRKK